MAWLRRLCAGRGSISPTSLRVRQAMSGSSSTPEAGRSSSDFPALLMCGDPRSPPATKSLGSPCPAVLDRRGVLASQMAPGPVLPRDRPTAVQEACIFPQQSAQTTRGKRRPERNSSRRPFRANARPRRTKGQPPTPLCHRLLRATRSSRMNQVRSRPSRWKNMNQVRSRLTMPCGLRRRRVKTRLPRPATNRR
jgi:hypothetical protein